MMMPPPIRAAGLRRDDSLSCSAHRARKSPYRKGGGSSGWVPNQRRSPVSASIHVHRSSSKAVRKCESKPFFFSAILACLDDRRYGERGDEKHRMVVEKDDEECRNGLRSWGSIPITLTPAGIKKTGMYFSKKLETRSIFCTLRHSVISSPSSSTMLTMLPGIPRGMAAAIGIADATNANEEGELDNELSCGFCGVAGAFLRGPAVWRYAFRSIPRLRSPFPFRLRLKAHRLLLFRRSIEYSTWLFSVRLPLVCDISRFR